MISWSVLLYKPLVNHYNGCVLPKVCWMLCKSYNNKVCLSGRKVFRRLSWWAVGHMAQWVKHLLSKCDFELRIYKCQVGLAACLEFQSSGAKTGSWASCVARSVPISNLCVQWEKVECNQTPDDVNLWLTQYAHKLRRNGK